MAENLNRPKNNPNESKIDELLKDNVTSVPPKPKESLYWDKQEQIWAYKVFQYNMEES